MSKSELIKKEVNTNINPSENGFQKRSQYIQKPKGDYKRWTYIDVVLKLALL